MTAADDIAQLQQQQLLLTQALSQMLVGNWCGEPPSVQAFISAIDPSLNPTCVPPLRQSDIPEPPPEPERYFDPNTDQPGQYYDWTCSGCSLDWLLRAYGSGFNPYDIYDSRQQTIEAIGYPNNINPTYGLMDGSGAQLQRVLRERAGLESAQGWLTFDEAYAIYNQGRGGMCSGGAWYHWVGIRGVDGDTIWVANSAPGYKSIWSNLTRDDWARLGPFSCVAVVG